MGIQMPPQYQAGMPPMQGQMSQMQGQMPPMQGQMSQMQGQMPPMQGQMQGPMQGYPQRQMPPQEMSQQDLPPSEEDPEEDFEGQNDYTKFGMEDDQGWMDRLIGGLKEPVIVAILYMILSLPMVNTLLMRFIPQIGNNTIMYLAFKTLIMVVLFTVIRYLVH